MALVLLLGPLAFSNGPAASRGRPELKKKLVISAQRSSFLLLGGGRLQLGLLRKMVSQVYLQQAAQLPNE